MAYLPPYSQRRTNRESRRVRTEAEERRAAKKRKNNRHRGRGAIIAEHARRAELRAAHGDYRFDYLDWQRLLDRYDYRCAYCGQPSDYLTRDHVVPLCRGGTHGVGNIVPACSPCNERKGAQLLSEWRYTSSQ